MLISQLADLRHFLVYCHIKDAALQSSSFVWESQVPLLASCGPKPSYSVLRWTLKSEFYVTITDTASYSRRLKF